MRARLPWDLAAKVRSEKGSARAHMSPANDSVWQLLTPTRGAAPMPTSRLTMVP
jgi:hypothetical protein